MHKQVNINKLRPVFRYINIHIVDFSPLTLVPQIPSLTSFSVSIGIEIIL